MTKLEEIAKIISLCDWDEPDFVGEQQWGLQKAREVVECLMEPSDDALNDGFMAYAAEMSPDPREAVSYYGLKAGWQAMLKAVLDEQA